MGVREPLLGWTHLFAARDVKIKQRELDRHEGRRERWKSKNSVGYNPLGCIMREILD